MLAYCYYILLAELETLNLVVLGSVLSTGASPMASPRLSPSGSPMINRRTGRSPVQSLMAAPPDPATHLVSTHLSDRSVTRQKSVILCTALI